MTLFILMLIMNTDGAITLHHQNIYEVAAKAFEQGSGRSYAIQASGLQDAVQLVPGRFRELSLGAMPEINTSQGDRGEFLVNLDATMSLADIPRLERDILSSEAMAAARLGLSEKLKFTSDVFNFYADALEAKLLLEHIRELHQQAVSLEQNLERQAERQLVSRADLLAQRVLTGHYANEIREMEMAFHSAKIKLEGLLGDSVTLEFPDEISLNDLEDNPFGPLSERIAMFPDLLLLDAKADNARRQAALTEAINAPKLGPGLQYRDEDGGNSWLGLGVKVSFSLRPRRDAAWRKHSAEAESLEARQNWMANTLKADLERRTGLYEQNKELAAAYFTEILEPLHHQVEIYEKAVSAGHMERRFLLQAQTEFHEAEHNYLLLVHRLWTESVEARILNQITAQGAPK